jgi:hypothetical protein
VSIDFILHDLQRFLEFSKIRTQEEKRRSSKNPIPSNNARIAMCIVQHLLIFTFISRCFQKLHFPKYAHLSQQRPEMELALISRGIFHCWRSKKLMSCHNGAEYYKEAHAVLKLRGTRNIVSLEWYSLSLRVALPLHISGSFRCREHIEPFIQAQFLHVTLIWGEIFINHSGREPAI